VVTIQFTTDLPDMIKLTRMEEYMFKTHPRINNKRIILILLGIGLLALAAEAADAAMQAIQLNSSASFPVDI